MTVVPRQRTPNELLGARLLIAAQAMFFVGLAFVALYMRRTAAAWPPGGADGFAPLVTVGGAPLLVGSPLLAANVAVLLAAALAARMGRLGTSGGHGAGARRWFGLAFGLGALFLCGQWLELGRLVHATARTDGLSMLLGTIALLHGLHVAGGLAILAFVLAPSGRTATRRTTLPRIAEWYWLFVAVAWLALLGVLTVV